MMNFIVYNLTLIVSSIAYIVIFSVLVMACLLPVGLVGKLENPPKGLLLVVGLLAWLFQAYLWGFWGAYCASTASIYTVKPEVSWDWLYWLCGFFAATAPIRWLLGKEQQGQAQEATKGITVGAMVYGLVAAAAFALFAVAPHLIPRPYEWILKRLPGHTQGTDAASSTRSGGE